MKAKLVSTGTDYKSSIMSIYRMGNGRLVKVKTVRLEIAQTDYWTGVTASLFNGNEWNHLIDSTCYESKVVLEKTYSPDSQTGYVTKEQWQTFQKAREEEIIRIIEEIFTDL